MRVTIDAAAVEGRSLTPKLAFFNSGLVPLSRYERDIHLIDRLRPQSLRLDLFMGDPKVEFGNLVTGTPTHPVYHFEAFDRFIELLKEHGVAPYVSWCYMPLPLQPKGGDFRSYPVDEEAYCRILRDLSAHLKELMGDGPYYEEAYNEPDCGNVFLNAPFDAYLRLYELEMRAFREAGSTAKLGGPVEAYTEAPRTVRENMTAFLKFVRERDLPLDFFSYHSYGYAQKEYLSRTHEVEELLAKDPAFSGVELHLNELNVEPPPWEYGKTMLETAEILPVLLQAMAELTETTRVTLIHWAQFLNSGVDAWGVVTEDGGLLPAFYAFEILARLPQGRLPQPLAEPIGRLAAVDGKRFGAVFWNNTKAPVSLELSVLGLPAGLRRAKLYRLDRAFFAGLAEKPQRPLADAVVLEGMLPEVHRDILNSEDVLYLECE